MTDYKSTMDWMNDNVPFMVTPVINLGRPRLDTNIPTAQVEYADDNGDIQLAINPEFFAKHTEPECAGVLTHELYHILFNHLAEFDKFENDQARTIAQECIVNDSVLEEGMELPDIGLAYGMDWVKYNASFLPTKVVYDDLMMDPDKLPQEIQVSCSHGHGREEGEDGQSQGGLDPREAFGKVFQNADIDEASESMKAILEDAAKKAGTGFQFKRGTQSGKKISLKWTDLINRIHPDTFSEGGKSKSNSTWARPRRKLAGMNPRVMLPDRNDQDKCGLGGNKRPKIIMALDTSGSVPAEKVTELMDLARSIPKRKVDVVCCTFSTEHEPFNPDVKPEDQRIASGGTDFATVVEFVKKQKNWEKASVIVITDGYAQFGWYGRGTPAPANLNTHWHWLVFNGDGVQDDRVTKNIYQYDEYVG